MKKRLIVSRVYDLKSLMQRNGFTQTEFNGLSRVDKDISATSSWEKGDLILKLVSDHINTKIELYKTGQLIGTYVIYTAHSRFTQQIDASPEIQRFEQDFLNVYKN